jgi:hypothetical protein
LIWHGLWLLLVSQGWLASLAAESQATEGPLVDRLVSVWSEQRRDVRTVELRFRRFRRGGDFLRRTPSQFHELVQRFDLAENPDALRPLVVELLGRTLPVDPPWAVREFLQSQQRVRERGPGWDLIVDGSSELVCDEGNRFIKLYTPGKGAPRWVAARWSDFRWVPPDDPAFRKLSLLRRDAEQAWFSLESGMELQVAVPTADVLRLTVRDPLGTVTREWYQLAWRAIDSVRVPTVVVRTVYRSGLLSMLTITILEQARFNHELPRETFRRAAVPGDLIRDRRGRAPRDYEVQTTVSDVLSVVGGRRSHDSGSRSDWGFRGWLLLNLGWVLGVGFWWWRRVRHGRC